MKSEVAIVIFVILIFSIHTANAIPTLDNANGGTWREYIHIPFVTPTAVDSQYMIKIDGTNISIYNSTGFLKISGTCTAFWNYVNTTGADIRVTNQSSELYFWIPKFNATTKQAVIWVNLTTGSTELDIYYGNKQALPSRYDNVSKTFLFYDDFNNYATGSLAGQNGWYSVVYGIAYTEGEIKVGEGIVYSGSGTEMVCKNVSITGTNFVLRFRINGTSPGNNLGVLLINSTGTGWFGATIGESYYGTTYPLGYATGKDTYNYFGTGISTSPTGWLNCTVVINYNKYSFVKIGSQSTSNVALTEVMNGISKIAIIDRGNLAAAEYDNIMVIYHNDPAVFKTPVQLPVGKDVPTADYINVTYNAYNITGHILINNSTSLLTPVFIYKPSPNSTTGYIGTCSVSIPNSSNITIYLDKNYTLNSVVCNGTTITPSFIGTTTLDNITYNVYNFISPSTGLLTITANVTPITTSGDTPMIHISNTPTFNITSEVSLIDVNATYGATVKICVEQSLSLDSVEYNNAYLTIPVPTTKQIDGKNYSVYTFNVYNSSDMFVTVKAQNLLYNTTQLYADNNKNFTYILVGEPLKIISPFPCNITIGNSIYTHITSKEITPLHIGKVTGTLYLFNLSKLEFGYKTFSVPVIWGHINLTIAPPVYTAKSIYSITYSKLCSIDKLYAGENRITIYYLGMPVSSKEFYLNHTNNGINITMSLNATNISSKCYNITIVSSKRFNITNLHKLIPYGKFAVNHTGEVIIHFVNNPPVTVTVEGNRYSYYTPYLYIYGSGNATVIPYYKLKIDAENALGIPMNITIHLNGKKMGIYGLTNEVLPVDKYSLEFPKMYSGFILRNENLTKVSLNLTSNKEVPPAIYKVPTYITLSTYKINATSFKFPILIPFIPLSKNNGIQKACIDGKLYNWYNAPVLNANVTIKITSLKTGYTITKHVNTSTTGTFNVSFDVASGVNYSISAIYRGSDIYVESYKHIVVAGGSLPPAPSSNKRSLIVLSAIAITVLGIGIGLLAYMLHKRSISKAMNKLGRGKYFRRVK